MVIYYTNKSKKTIIIVKSSLNVSLLIDVFLYFSIKLGMVKT